MELSCVDELAELLTCSITAFTRFRLASRRFGGPILVVSERTCDVTAAPPSRPPEALALAAALLFPDGHCTLRSRGATLRDRSPWRAFC